MVLQANQKFIDASHVAHLLTAGEKYADSLIFSVDRFYHGKDLSGCLFVIRGVNSASALSMQTLTQKITETTILLTWDICPAFTAVSGMLALEIVCYDNDGMILKYAVTPMQVRASVLEEYSGGVDAIEEALKEMEQILGETRAVSVKLPIIQNGTWWLYNTDSGAYEDSGQAAQGADGAPGADGRDGASAYETAVRNGFQGTESEWLASLHGADGSDGQDGMPGTDGAPGTDGKNGQDGKSAYQIWLDNGNTGTETDFLESLKGTDGTPGSDGQNGADGFSPTAKVEKSGSVITITVTDIDGTTTASITEGATVDLTPYAPIAYVDEQIQNVHTHSNLETLEEITETIWVDILEKKHSHPNYVAVNALTMTHLDNISQCANAIQELKLQIGDIQTALANIVEVTE